MHPQSNTPDAEFISNTWRQSGEEWTRKTDEATKKGKTLVLSGHGVKLNVNRGALIVQDGLTHSTHQPETQTLYRGIHGIDRIVIVSPTGSVTFDALRWCEQQKILVEVIFEEDGDELVSGLSSLGGRETADVVLRRAQYQASTNGRDLLIGRWLLMEKVRGQLGVLERVVTTAIKPNKRKGIGRKGFGTGMAFEEAIDRFKRIYLPGINEAPSIEMMRRMEGKATADYYVALENVPLRWAVRDKNLVPEHWLAIGLRQSQMMYKTPTPRHATNPANAIRNLAFTVLANQVRIAAAVKGLDVTCGWVQADREGRDNLIYDLIEPYRPIIDEKVIHLVTNARFTYGDFVTTKEGQVRLHPALAKFVVSTCVIPWTEIDLTPVEKLLMKS